MMMMMMMMMMLYIANEGCNSYASLALQLLVVARDQNSVSELT